MTSKTSAPLHIGLLRESGLNESQIESWMRTPNEACGGRTPQEVVDGGEADALADALFAAALGSPSLASKTAEDPTAPPRITVAMHAFGADLIMTEADLMTIRQLSWEDLEGLARQGVSVGSAEDLRAALTRQSSSPKKVQ